MTGFAPDNKDSRLSDGLQIKGLLSARNSILFLCALIALSISYYFFIALPNHNQALLDLERDKFQAEQAERKTRDREIEQKKIDEEDAKRRAEIARQEKEELLSDCTSNAEDVYWNYIKLNGTPVEGKPGVYSAPQYVWDRAAKSKKTVLDECYRKYRQ